jgi:hypothetical protein
MSEWAAISNLSWQILFSIPAMSKILTKDLPGYLTLIYLSRLKGMSGSLSLFEKHCYMLNFLKWLTNSNETGQRDETEGLEREVVKGLLFVLA